MLRLEEMEPIDRDQDDEDVEDRLRDAIRQAMGASRINPRQIAFGQLENMGFEKRHIEKALRQYERAHGREQAIYDVGDIAERLVRALSKRRDIRRGPRDRPREAQDDNDRHVRPPHRRGGPDELFANWKPKTIDFAPPQYQMYSRNKGDSDGFVITPNKLLVNVSISEMVAAIRTKYSGLVEMYTRDFNDLKADPSMTLIDGQICFEFFQKYSELHFTVLVQIWLISDFTADGKLDTNEFIVARYLIYVTRKGEPLPLSIGELHARLCGDDEKETETGDPTKDDFLKKAAKKAAAQSFLKKFDNPLAAFKRKKVQFAPDSNRDRQRNRDRDAIRDNRAAPLPMPPPQAYVSQQMYASPFQFDNVGPPPQMHPPPEAPPMIPNVPITEPPMAPRDPPFIIPYREFEAEATAYRSVLGAPNPITAVPISISPPLSIDSIHSSEPDQPQRNTLKIKRINTPPISDSSSSSSDESDEAKADRPMEEQKKQFLEIRAQMPLKLDSDDNILPPPPHNRGAVLTKHGQSLKNILPPPRHRIKKRSNTGGGGLSAKHMPYLSEAMLKVRSVKIGDEVEIRNMIERCWQQSLVVNVKAEGEAITDDDTLDSIPRLKKMLCRYMGIYVQPTFPAKAQWIYCQNGVICDCSRGKCNNSDHRIAPLGTHTWVAKREKKRRSRRRVETDLRKQRLSPLKATEAAVPPPLPNVKSQPRSKRQSQQSQSLSPDAILKEWPFPPKHKHKHKHKHHDLSMGNYQQTTSMPYPRQRDTSDHQSSNNSSLKAQHSPMPYSNITAHNVDVDDNEGDHDNVDDNDDNTKPKIRAFFQSIFSNKK